MSRLTMTGYDSNELAYLMVAGSFGDFRKGDAVITKVYQPGSLLSDIQVYTEQT
jgi:hypothetical protein